VPADRPNKEADLLRMAVPLVISFTLRQAFAMVDLVYAGLLDDPSALAAISLFIPFHEIYIALWVGLSAGFTAGLAHAFGRRDEARVRALKRSMLRLQAALVPLLASGGVVLWFVLPEVGLAPEVVASFRLYGTTLLVGLPLTGFWSIYPDSIVKAHYDTRATMLAGIYASLTNIALNTVFVFACGWGIFGIALATVLSRLVALAYAAGRARRHERARLLDPSWAAAPRGTWPHPLTTVLTLALPASLTFALTSAENSLVNLLLAGLADAEVALASYGVYYNLLRLACMPAIATAVAVVPYVARMVPEGHHARVAADLRRVLALAALFGLAFTIPVGVLFPAEVAGFFVRSADARTLADPTTRDVLRLLPIAALAGLPFLVLRPVFEALQRPRLGVLVSIARFVLLSAPCVLGGRALAEAAGLAPTVGVVAGLCTATLVASLLTVALVRRSLGEAAGAG
jgi:Na+-driven multidrug efflux pump